MHTKDTPRTLVKHCPAGMLPPLLSRPRCRHNRTVFYRYSAVRPSYGTIPIIPDVRYDRDFPLPSPGIPHPHAFQIHIFRVYPCISTSHPAFSVSAACPPTLFNVYVHFWEYVFALALIAADQDMYAASFPGRRQAPSWKRLTASGSSRSFPHDIHPGKNGSRCG